MRLESRSAASAAAGGPAEARFCRAPPAVSTRHRTARLRASTGRTGARKHRECKEPGPSRCESRRRQVMQSDVQYRGTYGCHAMCPSWRPAHALALAHSGIGKRIDQSFGARGRDRSSCLIAASILDEGAIVVGQIGAQVLAVVEERANRRTKAFSVHANRLFDRTANCAKYFACLGSVPFQIRFCVLAAERRCRPTPARRGAPRPRVATNRGCDALACPSRWRRAWAEPARHR